MSTTMTEFAGDVAVGRHVTAGGNAEVKGSVCIEKDLIVKGWLDAPNIKRMHKGLFSTESDLIEAYPRPQPGWWALVGRMLPAQLYLSQGGRWRGQTDEAGEPILTGEPTLELIGFREELDSIPCDFVYDEEASGISNCIIKLVLKNGSSLPLSLPKASMTAAGIIRAGSYKKYEEASVNGINAIEWLNEFKAKTAEDFSDVYTIMSDYADGEEFYYFKQETQNQLDLLDRKIDTVQGLHNQDMDSIADEIKAAKRAVFDDLWNTVWGLYGKYDPKNAPDPEHPYMGNDIWLTYEEALIVMNEKDMAINPYFCTIKGRTTVPHESYRDNDHGSLEQRFINCPNLEVLCISRSALRFTGNCFGALSNCPNLKKIIGQWWLHNTNASSTDLLVHCPKIEEFQFFIGFSLNLGNCPKVSRNSIKFLIDHAQNGTKDIIITVHEEVYAKLTGDPNSPYLIEITVAELQEWMELVELAAAKNITFACA